MKKAIYTIAIGRNPAQQLACETFRQYAEKVGADLIVCRKNRYFNKKAYLSSGGRSFSKAACLEKFYIKELFKYYDRVLYLDSDILIAPNAPDIFERYNKLDTVYMFNEAIKDNRSEIIQQTRDFFNYQGKWPKVSDSSVYCNAGVILSSRKSHLFELASFEELYDAHDNDLRWFDQSYVNYLLARHQLHYELLPKEWNQMAQFCEKDQRFLASFIHYAGIGFAEKKGDRFPQMVEDYLKMYRPELSEKEKKQILKKYKVKFFLAKLDNLFVRKLMRPLVHYPLYPIMYLLRNMPA